MVLGQEQEGGPLGAIGLQQGQGLRFDGAAEVAALAIEGFALPCQGQGAVGIVSGEQFHHQLGIAQPAHGVNAGGDLKAHRLGVEGGLVQPGQLLQGL